MSHVDEGTLHAYFDGELPSGDRATLEAHVAECATCRAALADERALRDRASALLGSARPIERPAPPLEQLRRAFHTKRSPWRVRTSFAWAASIVLALGVGYLLRGAGSESPTVDRQEPAATLPIVSQPIVVAENRTARAPAPSREKATTRRPPPAPADELERASVQSKARADNADSSNAPARILVRGSAPDSLARDRSPEFRLDGVVVTGAAAPTRAAAGAATPTPAPALAQQRGSVWPVITRVAARALLGTDPVGLPGLPTRAIRLGPERGGVVVEQALDSGTVIQIFQSPAGANAFADREGRVRSDRLARFIGGLRVEIAGPVSLDSLNRLLNQVQPLP